MKGLLLVLAAVAVLYLLFRNQTTVVVSPPAPAPTVPPQPITITFPTPGAAGVRVPGSQCFWSPPCNAGQACSMIMVNGIVAADGSCQPAALPIAPGGPAMLPL